MSLNANGLICAALIVVAFVVWGQAGVPEEVDSERWKKLQQKACDEDGKKATPEKCNEAQDQCFVAKTQAFEIEKFKTHFKAASDKCRKEEPVKDICDKKEQKMRLMCYYEYFSQKDVKTELKAIVADADKKKKVIALFDDIYNCFDEAIKKAKA